MLQRTLAFKGIRSFALKVPAFLVSLGLVAAYLQGPAYTGGALSGPAFAARYLLFRTLKRR